MTLRITDRAQLEGMSSGFQQRLRDASGQHELARRAPASKRPRYLEEAEGREIVKWIDALVFGDTRLGAVRVGEYFVHVPNGGARGRKEAAILKGQGVRPGWPDYALFLPRGQYCGAVGELKRVDGAKPDDAQLEILMRLERAGYKAMVWFGAEDAKSQILGYLQLGSAR